MGGEGEGGGGGDNRLCNTDGHCIRRQELHNALGAHFPVSYPCDKNTNNVAILREEKIPVII